MAVPICMYPLFPRSHIYVITGEIKTSSIPSVAADGDPARFRGSDWLVPIRWALPPFCGSERTGSGNGGRESDGGRAGGVPRRGKRFGPGESGINGSRDGAERRG